MVLLFPGFKADKVFAWVRRDKTRTAVCVPAEPFLDACEQRIEREVRAGKQVVVWGNPGCLDQVAMKLQVDGITTAPFDKTGVAAAAPVVETVS